jgi:hypothetical protein
MAPPSAVVVPKVMVFVAGSPANGELIRGHSARSRSRTRKAEIKKPLVHQDGGFNPWRILFRGIVPAHRIGALTPIQGTLAFSEPGCHVLSLTGPFLMLERLKQVQNETSKTFCVIKRKNLNESE